jgi:formate dehydrogenase maturation protein FdhE
MSLSVIVRCSDCGGELEIKLAAVDSLDNVVVEVLECEKCTDAMAKKAIEDAERIDALLQQIRDFKYKADAAIEADIKMRDEGIESKETIKIESPKDEES